MTSGRTRLPGRMCLAALLTAAALLSVLGAARPAGGPAPGQAGRRAGGFYTYPGRQALARARPGDVFASEPMTVTAALRRVSSRALRIMYRSAGLDGRPVAVTGFLLVPRGRPPARGWPVVAWAHGTSGVGPACAPSRWPNLYPSPFQGYELLVARLLHAGYAVTGTDYPGLGFPGMLHGYLQLGPESRSVADSVLAARRLAPQLGRDWFAVGHSQGGQAALGTGEIAAQRAARLRFLGTVALAPANHLREMTQLIALLPPPYPAALSKLGAFGSYLAVGAHLYAPRSFQYRDLLSPGLTAQMPAAQRLCDEQLTVHLATVLPRLRQLVNPRWESNRGLARFYAQAEPAHRRSAGPVLLLQGDLDLAVPVLLTDQLDAELCALGDVVLYRTYPGTDHDGLLRAGFPLLSAWLHSRLLGRPAPQTCPRGRKG